MLTLHLDFLDPKSQKRAPIREVLADSKTSIGNASADLRFAAAVAAFGMKLRGDESMNELTYDKIADLAESGASSAERAEFVILVKKAKEAK